MESTFRLRRSIIAAMLLALTLVLGRFFLIPIPWTHGNVNLCDAGVFIAAMLLGPGAGTIVGGFRRDDEKRRKAERQAGYS